MKMKGAPIPEATPTDPYRGLVAAVVNRAVDDVFATKGKGAVLVSRRDSKEARRWLLASDRGPFTAQWCYSMLGLSGSAVRESLSRRLDKGKGHDKQGIGIQGEQGICRLHGRATVDT